MKQANFPWQTINIPTKTKQISYIIRGDEIDRPEILNKQGQSIGFLYILNDHKITKLTAISGELGRIAITIWQNKDLSRDSMFIRAEAVYVTIWEFNELGVLLRCSYSVKDMAQQLMGLRWDYGGTMCGNIEHKPS